MGDSVTTIVEYRNLGWLNDEEPPEPVLEKAVPLLLLYLSTSDILRCRLVSKSWNNEIDRFLCEENPLLRPYYLQNFRAYHYQGLPSNFLVREHFPLRVLRGSYKFHKVWTLSTFTRTMAGHLNDKRNPLIGRFVSVGLPDFAPQTHFQNVSDYWLHLEKFLRNFGYHIWYLRFYDDSEAQSADDFYFLLIRLIGHLPNLKLLDISSVRLANYSKKSLQAIAQTVEDNPFPVLASLDSVLLPRAVGALPEPIQHAIIRTHARQLRKLRCGLYTMPDDYPHLLTSLSDMTCFNVFSNEQIITTIGLFTIPLEKLVLDLRDGTKQICWSAETILSLLQGLPVNLVVLKLAEKVPLKETHTPSPIPIRDQFKVENVSTLEMNHTPNTSYNFLWCLPALKHLHIEFNPYVKGDLKGNLMKMVTGSGTDVGGEDQELDIREMIESGADLYGSNIWRVLPKLQVLTYLQTSWLWGQKRKVYTREVLEWKKMEAKRIAEDAAKRAIKEEVKSRPSPQRVNKKRSKSRLGIMEAYVYHNDGASSRMSKPARRSRNKSKRSIKLNRL